MLNKALEAFADLGDDEELGPTNWPTVKRYIASLNDVGGLVDPQTVHRSDNNTSPTNLKDTRIHILNSKYIFTVSSSHDILF